LYEPDLITQFYKKKENHCSVRMGFVLITIGIPKKCFADTLLSSTADAVLVLKRLRILMPGLHQPFRADILILQVTLPALIGIAQCWVIST
jgi:hypothetical protein